MLDFERYFEGATIRKLERNYRSTQAILDTAGALVEHNQRRRPKKLWTDLSGGDLPELYRGRDEGVKPADLFPTAQRTLRRPRVPRWSEHLRPRELRELLR